MSNPSPPPDSSRRPRWFLAWGRRLGWLPWSLAGLAAAAAVAWWVGGEPPEPRLHAEPRVARGSAGSGGGAGTPREASRPVVIRLSEDQQRAVGLRTAKVDLGAGYDVLSAPGRVAPNELQYAYITPRAPGVVRSVNAHVGQDVRAGDLLATIDSAVVGEARLDLYTKLQTLEVTRAQADWQETIYRNTLELIEHLRKGESPEEIQGRFAEKPVGENRERLMTAYAQYRLGVATHERNRELHAQRLITPKQFQQATADYEVALATYQGLMDQMGYQAKLDHTRARQSMQQAEAAVRAARERLKILGVKPDGTEPEVAGGKVVGVKPDGTLPASKQPAPVSEKPETVLPPARDAEGATVEPVGARPTAAPDPRETPVSTYSIWAPFDGTILDREMIVPGVAVDTAHRIFTMANLSSVWVEANIHESDFDMLAHSREGKVRFRSRAYPGRVFEGEVIYSGDLVEEQSRTVKLLARARNPERLLKPGMFIEVEILSPMPEPTPRVAASALLTQEDETFVYVRTGPEEFERRTVVVGTAQDDQVVVRRGLKPGEEVVVEGGFKLKALAIQLASAR